MKKPSIKDKVIFSNKEYRIKALGYNNCLLFRQACPGDKIYEKNPSYKYYRWVPVNQLSLV